MGTTTLSSRREALAAQIGQHGTIPPHIRTLIDQSIGRALRKILAYHRWDFMNGEWRVRLYPAYSTGTITGSGTAITGSGTSWDTTWPATHARMRIGNEVYRVSSFDSTTAITLTDTPLSDPSGSDYSIFFDRYVVGSNVETIESVALANPAFSRLQGVAAGYMDERKARLFQIGHPENWASRGLDSSGDLLIELYPIPSASELLYVRGRKDATIPTADDDVDDVPDRFSYVVELCALEYLFQAGEKWEAYSAARQEAGTALLRMVTASDPHQGETRFMLDPAWHRAHESLTDTQYRVG